MRRGTWMIAAMIAVMLAGGCTGAGSTAEETGGDLFISGSSTVEPISALVAELFSEENPDVSISVEGPGTGDGFELFCNGETDVADASRPIAEEEAEVCAQNGVTYVELEVAIDGMAVMTHPENDAVSCMSFADTYALMGPESEGFTSWADANDLARELDASAAPYPDLPLVIVAPGEESGTYDSFIEIAWGDLIEERAAEEAARPDYQASPNDNVIIEGISGSEGSLGWVGYAFYVQNQDVVKALEIDGGEGCVAPTEETIADGSYPLQRSLYIYVNAAKAADKPELRGYVDMYLSETGLQSAVERVGYVPLPEERRQATLTRWEGERPA